MTRPQLNTLAMLNATIKYLNDNSLVWGGNSVVSAGVKAFTTSKGNIDAAATVQQANGTTGVTDQKNIDYETMLDLAYKLGVRVYNYASGVGNIIMRDAVHYSRSALEELGEEAALLVCNNIVTQANAALATLPAPNPDYKITTTGVGAAQDAIDLVTPEIPAIKEVRGVRSASTAWFKPYFADTHTKLELLDKLIEGMADDDDDAENSFVAGYEQVRKTDNLRARGKDKVAPAPPPVKVG